MITKFEMYRLKSAGMTNLNLLALLKFYKKHQDSRKLSAREMGQIAGVKALADFTERYKTLDSKELKANFDKFPCFSIFDADYPERLRQIYNPPVLLFYQGNLDLLKQPKIGFVGAREASKAGIEAVKKLVSELDRQFVVVSGLARGIDAASHIAAVKSGAGTIAVIGTGLDGHYPSENRALQDYLAQNALVLSEYGPEEKPVKWHFPERNRIIAGLSMGIVVVEAKTCSGSLITAERAMEEGRDVFAVPGDVVSGHSNGCHSLIQQGAKLTMTGRDVLEEYV